ncbi:TPA: HYR domain-containing protein [Bacillus pseudomycoides]|nr:HYR domain-containing protein [Bacillus pseudomycoides]
MFEENLNKLSLPLQLKNLAKNPSEIVPQVINTTDIQLSTNSNADNEPTVGVNPNNPLSIVAASHAYGLPNGFPQFGVYRSTDGGSTFATTLLPVPTGFDFLSDPVIDADLHNRYLLSGIAVKEITPEEGQIIVYRSVDDGQTFSNAIIVSDRPANGIFDDKPFLAIDKTTTGPTQGNAYISYTRFTNNETNSQILFQRSTDGGLTWPTSPTSPLPITPVITGTLFVQGSNVQVGPNGEVYVAWLEEDATTASFKIRRSDDGGLSFGPTVTVRSAFVKIPDPLTSRVSQWAFRTPTFAFLAVDRSGCFGSAQFARVFAVWQEDVATMNPPNSRNAHILMSFSDDGGVTWSTPSRVDDSPENTQNFFPFVDVSACSGTCSVIYYTNRVASPNLDVFAAVSTNGGASFTNSRITNVSSNPNGTFGNPATFIGDYIFSAMIPPSLPNSEKLISVWTDFRTGNQDIFANISDLIRPAPTITCTGDITVDNTPGQSGAIVNYPSPIVTDSCPGAIVSCSPPSGSFFQIGSTTVTCTATDPCGGAAANCSFTVTVTPTNPISTGKSVPLLLASIAFEELALAHIMNAEAEKLQFVLGTLTPARTLTPSVITLSNLLTVDASVQRTLRDVIKKEMLLEFKFENVFDFIATFSPSQL